MLDAWICCITSKVCSSQCNGFMLAWRQAGSPTRTRPMLARMSPHACGQHLRQLGGDLLRLHTADHPRAGRPLEGQDARQGHPRGERSTSRHLVLTTSDLVAKWALRCACACACNCKLESVAIAPGMTYDYLSSVSPQVLKHLTVKRPLDVNRMDFFAQASRFFDNCYCLPACMQRPVPATPSAATKPKPGGMFARTRSFTLKTTETPLRFDRRRHLRRW